MNNGNVNNDNKNNNNYVWPVRAGEWTPRAPDNSGDRPTAALLFAKLYKSWKRCRRMKRNSINALKFEYRAEFNLLELAEELASGNYQPSRVIRFAVDRPKLREIVAADFRDRIVHHYLVERLERIFEPVFIHDSYACRIGKGVHKGLTRVREFIRKGTKNGKVPLYALHLDVKSFFVTIDRRILARIVEEQLVKEAQRVGESGENLSFLNTLTSIILTHEPLSERIDKGDRKLLNAIPPHKTLLHAPFGVGLPVGNLTSQFFANVYLNELDQHCKHTLKCRYYLRYCDDFLILDSDPKRLEIIREDVRRFLQQRLRLELNTRYAAITDVRNGIDFIGYIIRPEYVLVRRRTVNNLKTRLDKYERENVRTEMYGDTLLYAVSPEPKATQHIQSVVASYSGHFKWGNTHRLKRSMFVRYPWMNALFRMDSKGMPKIRRPAGSL